MAHQSHTLDLPVLNKCLATRAIVTPLNRRLARRGCIAFESHGNGILIVNLREEHCSGRMRQAKPEIADAELVSWAKLGTGQTWEVSLRGDSLTRRQTKHLLVPEHEQAMMRFDRRMAQNQIVVFAASDA